MQIAEDDLNADWMSSQNMIPGSPKGLLNEINKRGLLTYTDFNFLFLLMSTPRHVHFYNYLRRYLVFSICNIYHNILQEIC